MPGAAYVNPFFTALCRDMDNKQGPSEFSVMPSACALQADRSDVLGQVYEQLLGKVIRLTAGHQAKVEEKPKVRKAGGKVCPPALDLVARRDYIDSVNAR